MSLEQFKKLLIATKWHDEFVIEENLLHLLKRESFSIFYVQIFFFVGGAIDEVSSVNITLDGNMYPG